MAINKKKKPITIDDLAKTVNSLALSVGKGFDTVNSRINESEKRIIKNIDAKINSKIDELAIITKNGFERVDKKLEDLENRQEDIKIRQDNATYRIDFNVLEKRVDRLESIDKVNTSKLLK